MTRLLERLRELDEKATPGPWSLDGPYVVGLVPEGRPGGEVIVQARETRTSLRDEIPHEANAALVVAAVNALPAVVALIEALAEHSTCPGCGANATQDEPHDDDCPLVPFVSEATPPEGTAP